MRSSHGICSHGAERKKPLLIPDEKGKWKKLCPFVNTGKNVRHRGMEEGTEVKQDQQI